MAKTQTRPARRAARPKGKPTPARRKKLQRPWYRRYSWLPWVIGLVALAVVLVVRSGQTDAPAPGVAGSNPVVGGDLHSFVVDSSDRETIYIGGHQGVSVSRDGGETWEVVQSLNGADAMGWAFTDDAIFVGGHPGLMVSTDSGVTFEPRNEGLPSTDVHALGAGEEVLYAGLAGVGTFASTDSGRSWEERSKEFGAAFMGRIQVDAADDEHLLAPDMGAGAVESRDGGRTWEPLGGVPGAMWVTWDVNDTDHMIVVGQKTAVESSDGGTTWEPLEIPAQASIVELSPHDPEVLYAAVLQAPEAAVYVSKDGGATWTRP